MDCTSRVSNCNPHNSHSCTSNLNPHHYNYNYTSNNSKSTLMPVTGCNSKSHYCTPTSKLMPGLALSVYEVVRELSLKLSTILSVSVTRYKRDLGSVNTDNRHFGVLRVRKDDLTYGSTPKDDLKYLFYFTHFPDFKIHPFYTEFTDKIREHIDKLDKAIAQLDSSHSQLTKSIKATESATSLILEYIGIIGESVQDSINQSTEHIQKQIKTNKDSISSSVTQIEGKITAVDNNLTQYINDELAKIMEKLISEVTKIKDGYIRTQSDLRETRDILTNIRSNVSNLQSHVERILDRIKADEENRSIQIEQLIERIQTYGYFPYIKIEVEKIKGVLEKFKKNMDLKEVQQIKKEVEQLLKTDFPQNSIGIKGYLRSLLQVCDSKLEQAEREAKVREVLGKVKSSLEKSKGKGIKDNIQKINQSLEGIKTVVTNLNHPKFKLVYEQLGNDSDIQGFTEYSRKLEQTKTQIEAKKKEFDEAFNSIETSILSLQAAKKELETSKDLQVENKPRIESLIGSLITNKDAIEKSKTKLDEGINKLTSEIESIRQELQTLNPKPKSFGELFAAGFKSFLSWFPFTFTSSHSEQPNELESIGKQVEKLKAIRHLNEELQKHTRQSPKGSKELQEITEIKDKLSFDQTNLKQVETAINDFGRSDYHTHTSKIKGSVNKLLTRLQAIDADTPPKYGDTGKPLLKRVNESLTDINNKLSHLQKLGYNINNLLKMTQAIKDLESIKSEIETVKPVNQEVQEVKPSQQEISSTFERLQKAKETFMSGLATIESIGSLIQELTTEKRQKLERLNQMEQTFDWLSHKHAEISILTSNLESLASSEVSKKEDTLITRLKEFSEKLQGEVASNLTTIMSKLELYSAEYKQFNNNSNGNTHTGSQPSTQAGRQVESQPVEVRQGGSIQVTKEIQDIRNLIKDIKDSKIPGVKANIQYILDNDVTSKYQEYSQTFAHFRQQIDRLYHCIDYVVRDFIRCSLESLGVSLRNIHLNGYDYLKVRQLLYVLREVTSELSKSISCLIQSHFALYLSVSQTYSNTHQLVNSMYNLRRLVSMSIHNCETLKSLRGHVHGELQDNRSKILQTIPVIEHNIDSVHSSLKEYVQEELKSITTEFIHNVKKPFTQFYSKMSPSLGFIKGGQDDKSSEGSTPTRGIKGSESTKGSAENTVDTKTKSEKTENSKTGNNKSSENIIEHFTLYSVNNFIEFLNHYLGKQAKGANAQKSSQSSSVEKLETINRTNITKHVDTLNTELPELKSLIEGLQEYKIERTLSSSSVTLDYGNLGNAEQALKGFTKYVEQLQAKKEEIKQKKDEITKAFQAIKDELEKLDKVKKKFVKAPFLKKYFKDSAKKIDKLLSVKTNLEKLVSQLESSIGTLDTQVQGIITNLQNITQQLNNPQTAVKGTTPPNTANGLTKLTNLKFMEPLRGLKQVKQLNDTLIGYKGGTPLGQLPQCPDQPSSSTAVLTEIRDNLRCLTYDAKTKPNEITNIGYFRDINSRSVNCPGGNSQGTNYSKDVSDIKQTVTRLLQTPELGGSDKTTTTNTGSSGRSSNTKLTKAKEDLEVAKVQLTNLTMYGNNIGNLEYITQTITHLQCIQREITELMKGPTNTSSSGGQPQPTPGSNHGTNPTSKPEEDSILDKLRKDRQKMEDAVQSLNCVGSNIEELMSLETNKLTQIQYNTKTLNSNYLSILTNNSKLQPLNNSEYLESLKNILPDTSVTSCTNTPPLSAPQASCTGTSSSVTPPQTGCTSQSPTLPAASGCTTSITTSPSTFSALDVVCEKLEAINTNLKQISCKLAQYLRDHKKNNDNNNNNNPSSDNNPDNHSDTKHKRDTGLIQCVKRRVDRAKDLTMCQMKHNISVIRQSGNQICPNYNSYSQSFQMFSQALTKFKQTIEEEMPSMLGCSYNYSPTNLKDILWELGIQQSTELPHSTVSHNHRSGRTIRSVSDSHSGNLNSSTSTSTTTLLTTYLARSLGRLDNRLRCYSWSVGTSLTQSSLHTQKYSQKKYKLFNITHPLKLSQIANTNLKTQNNKQISVLFKITGLLFACTFPCQLALKVC